MKVSRVLAAVIVGALVSGIGLMVAEGQGRLRAQVYFTQHQIPRHGTERSLVQFARAHKALNLAETKTAEPMSEWYWQANMVVQFNRSPRDLEYHVLFYDIGPDARDPERFIADMSMFISNQDERTFVQRIRLPRRRGFRPNRYYKAVITVAHDEAATARIALIGDEPRRSGTVDFSDDET